MNSTEDRLRIALRITADQIGAGSVPGLQLPPASVRLLRAGAWRGNRWLAACAAAVAAALVIGLSVTLAGGARRAGPASPVQAAPPYYVALQYLPGCSLCVNDGGQPYYQSDPDRALIRATDSGSTLAVVPVPKPYQTFAAVAAAADDRTFVLAAQKTTRYGFRMPTRFYLLRFDPQGAGGHRYRLTPLPLAALPGNDELLSLTLSPDSSRLAVLFRPGFGAGRVRVYDLAGQTQRTWQLPAAEYSLTAPTWNTDNQTLMVRATGPDPGAMLLDTARQHGSFAVDSRHLQLPGDSFTGGRLTPDGKHEIEMVGPILPGGPSAHVDLEVADLTTGAVTTLRPNLHDVSLVWTDPSGSAVIISSGAASWTPGVYSVITGHHQAVLKIPPGLLSAAW